MQLDDPVLLKTFPSVSAAEIAASRLRANGIECLIKTDDAGGMLPPLQTQEGVKLYVPRNQRDEALALLDVTQSAASLAEPGRWCRPIVADGTEFRIEAGRHPVVEAALAGAGAFVPNGCDL